MHLYLLQAPASRQQQQSHPSQQVPRPLSVAPRATWVASQLSEMQQLTFPSRGSLPEAVSVVPPTQLHASSSLPTLTRSLLSPPSGLSAASVNHQQQPAAPLGPPQVNLMSQQSAIAQRASMGQLGSGSQHGSLSQHRSMTQHSGMGQHHALGQRHSMGQQPLLSQPVLENPFALHAAADLPREAGGARSLPRMEEGAVPAWLRGDAAAAGSGLGEGLSGGVTMGALSDPIWLMGQPQVW